MCILGKFRTASMLIDKLQKTEELESFEQEALNGYTSAYQDIRIAVRKAKQFVKVTTIMPLCCP